MKYPYLLTKLIVKTPVGARQCLLTEWLQIGNNIFPPRDQRTLVFLLMSKRQTTGINSFVLISPSPTTPPPPSKTKT